MWWLLLPSGDTVASLVKALVIVAIVVSLFDVLGVMTIGQVADSIVQFFRNLIQPW